MASAAALLAGSVLLSRVVGYLRDVVLANRVGAGSEADAYYAAFQIPDILNYLLAGGALSIAFLPLYAGARDRRGPEAAERLFATILGTLGAAAVVATAALWWWCDGLVALQFPAFDADKRELTAHLTRIVLPGQVFFVVGGILRAVLMAEGRFGSQALAPLLYNGCIIAGGLVSGSAEGFAWGVLAGSVLGPFLVPFLDLRRTHRIRVRLAPVSPGFRRYLWAALPLMIGLSLATVDEWYDRWFGATLGAGAVAWLSFARKLMLAPVAVVGQALATAALPTLSHLHARGRHDDLHRTLGRTLQGAVGLALLAGAALWAFSEPLVELLYHHGRFSEEAAVRTAAVLAVMAFGVPGWVAQQVAVRAFYAREDTWRPMLVGTVVALLAVPLYWVLARRVGPEGLAAAGALAVSCNALATLALARRLHGGPDLGRLVASSLRGAAVAVAAGAAARVVVLQLGWAGKPDALLSLAAGGALFGALAAAGLHLVGDEAMRELVGRTAARLRRRRSGPG